MALMFSNRDDDPNEWRQALEREIPGLDVRVWPDGVGDPADIDYALVWRHPEGDLKNYPNLKCILSLAAGPEAILRDPDLPPDVPIVRLVDSSLSEDITLYCLHWVLHLHRGFHDYVERQRDGRWWRGGRERVEDRRVGVLGMGELGTRTAREVARLGFPTAGWSRTAKQVAGVESFHGEGSLSRFLARSDILICLLPLTKATEGILDRENLGCLPQGAHVINAGRGGHVVDGDLIALLDSGHLQTAVLDVFRHEPLPEDHPFWAHPKVIVTPHIAGRTHTQTAAAVICENVRRMERGEQPHPLIDRGLEY